VVWRATLFGLQSGSPKWNIGRPTASEPPTQDSCGKPLGRFIEQARVPSPAFPSPVLPLPYGVRSFERGQRMLLVDLGIAAFGQPDDIKHCMRFSPSARQLRRTATDAVGV